MYLITEITHHHRHRPHRLNMEHRVGEKNSGLGHQDLRRTPNHQSHSHWSSTRDHYQKYPARKWNQTPFQHWDVAATVPAPESAAEPTNAERTQQIVCCTWPAAAPQSQAHCLPHLIVETQEAQA